MSVQWIPCSSSSLDFLPSAWGPGLRKKEGKGWGWYLHPSNWLWNGASYSPAFGEWIITRTEGRWAPGTLGSCDGRGSCDFLSSLDGSDVIVWPRTSSDAGVPAITAGLSPISPSLLFKTHWVPLNLLMNKAGWRGGGYSGSKIRLLVWITKCSLLTGWDSPSMETFTKGWYTDNQSPTPDPAPGKFIIYIWEQSLHPGKTPDCSKKLWWTLTWRML